MGRASICVIWNPSAGRGAARRRLREVRRLLGQQAEFQASRVARHGEELAYDAAREGYATVVAAGGDGTVHEVANGLLRAGNADVAFGVIPLGSGNDYAHALGLPTDAGSLCKILRSEQSRRVDVGLVRDDRGRSRYFVNTLGLGLSGAVTYESRRIHGLSGLALYGLAALQAICRHFRAPPTVLSLDEQRFEITTLYLSVALGQREGGGFLVAPDARLDDGWFDYLHASELTRWRALQYLPGLAAGRIPTNDPAIRCGRCRKIEIQLSASLPVHLDGELFVQPQDEVRGLSIELLPRALPVRAKKLVNDNVARNL